MRQLQKDNSKIIPSQIEDKEKTVGIRMASIKFGVTVMFAMLTCLMVATQKVSGTIIAYSTFDSDADGWLFDPTDTSWEASGGNPGGYIRYDNNLGSSAQISAPEKFLGNWSDLNETGTITYEAKIFSTGSIYKIGHYGLMIKGPGGEANWTGPEPNPSAEWLTLFVPIQEQDQRWTVISGSWDAILSEVTEFKIWTAYYNNWGPFEITGIDNVCLVPEPSILCLLGLGSLLLRRRKNV